MGIKVKAVIAVLIALQSVVACAATPIPAVDVSRSTTTYAVSGILRITANGAEGRRPNWANQNAANDECFSYTRSGDNLIESAPVQRDAGRLLVPGIKKPPDRSRGSGKD